MSIIVKWTNLKGQPTQTELPDHARNIHKERGGWYTDSGVYLWWEEYGNAKCRALTKSRWAGIEDLAIDIIRPPASF